MFQHRCNSPGNWGIEAYDTGKISYESPGSVQRTGMPPTASTSRRYAAGCAAIRAEASGPHTAVASCADTVA